jgi:hypothetical protein
MSETLVALDMNFTNGGGGHSASTSSVIGAIGLGGSLGSLIGSAGSRVTFSNSSINSAFKNFIMTEETYSRDPIKTTVTRQYQDRISLLLKSYFIAVRGKDISPDGNLSYKGLVPFFGECKNSNSTKKFPEKPPQRQGGALIIGQIYNEISETIEGEENYRVSLIYQDGNLKEELSYNSSLVSSWYKNNPDLNSSVLKYGYTLSELNAAFALAGINVKGLPNRSDLLFDTSGSLDSVISSVASTFGLYWYIDPFAGTVNLISSQSAVNLNIPDPTQSNSPDILSSSYTINALKPVIANSYMSKISPKKFEYEYPDKQRIARFKLVDILGKVELGIPSKGFEFFYGSYAASKFSSIAFDAISIYALGYKKIKAEELFGEYYTAKFDSDTSFKTWSEVYKWSAAAKRAEEAFKGKFDLKKGQFLPIGENQLPSESTVFELVQNAFDILNNTIYISNAYSEWKAVRMSCSSSDGNVSGPFFEKELLENVEGLQSIASLLKALGKEEISLEDLAKTTKATGSGDHHFIALKPYGNSESKEMTSEEMKLYDLFNEENFIIYETPQKKRYAGFSPKLKESIGRLTTTSKNLFTKRIKDSKKSSTIKVNYTRTRRPTTDPRDAEEQKKEDDRKANLDSWGEKSTELLDKIELVITKTILGGASGDPLNPVQFNVKNGTLSEMNILEKSNSSAASTKGLKSSSKTMAGINIPKFDITLSGLQIRLGGQGATTTESRSTVPILQIDENLIISDGVANLIKEKSLKFSARQRNTMGL